MRIATILLLVLLSANRAPAQSRSSVNLEPAKELRPDVDAWPLIAHPTGPVERSVNAALVQLNNDLRKTLQDCDANVEEFRRQPGTAENRNKSTPDDWSRRVEVTMRGPRFLSMIATDGFFCGGGHPDDSLAVIVFDMQTGAMVDWASFLANEAGVTSKKDVPGYGAGTTPPVAFARLQTLYANAEEDYCKDYFEDQQSFLLWPDAKSGALIAEVAGLPHLAAPCKVDFKLTLNQARELGFDETLLAAIAQAHRQFAVKPH